MSTPPRRLAKVALLTLLLAGCGTEPVALLLVLDQVPRYFTGSWIVVSGKVTRTPPKKTTITVTVSGGQQAAADTADTSGVFGIRVTLNADRDNLLQVVAQDRQGNISRPETALITQDGVAPAIRAMSPVSGTDGVKANLAAVVIQFTEPVVLAPDANVRLRTAAHDVPGFASLATDSTMLTYSIQGGLRTNSVYEMRLSGIRDVAGNALKSGTDACFITERTGAAQKVATDSVGDLFGGGAPTGQSPSDLIEVRFGVHGTLLTGIMKFTTARSFDPAAVNNLLAFVEFDVDQDSTTGVRSIKDGVFEQNFPELSSGTGVEYVVVVDNINDSAAVGRYTAPDTIQALARFIPVFCGPFTGFSAAFEHLGNDDGNMNYVITTWNLEANGFVVDPTPTKGHDTLAFAGLFAPPVAAPPAVTGPSRRLRIRELPLVTRRPRR